MKFHSWGPRVNSSSDSITISKMILLLDEFLAISAVTKYFSWREGRRPSLPVYSQFTTPRWNRWHEFTVQFSILFLLPPPPFPLFAHLSQPSLRHSPLFTTSKRRRFFFTSLRRKNFWGEVAIRDFFYS